jgi:hypothetical protein
LDEQLYDAVEDGRNLDDAERLAPKVVQLQIMSAISMDGHRSIKLPNETI